MKHTIKAFDSAYPGSMFEKPHGSYVERDDAKSLAAALLEIIATEKRSASDLLDALQESRDEFHALKAQMDELLADLKLIAETDPVDAALDPQRAVRVAVAALAKHKEASHG